MDTNTGPNNDSGLPRAVKSRGGFTLVELLVVIAIFNSNPLERGVYNPSRYQPRIPCWAGPRRR